jgi:hypothetical protein
MGVAAEPVAGWLPIRRDRTRLEDGVAVVLPGRNNVFQQVLGLREAEIVPECRELAGMLSLQPETIVSSCPHGSSTEAQCVTGGLPEPRTRPIWWRGET